MGFGDKVSHKARELRGRMKRNAGRVSGDRRLEAEGTSDEVVANLKQAGEKLEDAVRGTMGPRRRRRTY